MTRPKTACVSPHTISKKTVVASFQPGTRTREWLDSLDDGQWRVVSFTPGDRTVCLSVDGRHGVLTAVSLTLPAV